MVFIDIAVPADLNIIHKTKKIDTKNWHLRWNAYTKYQE